MVTKAAQPETKQIHARVHPDIYEEIRKRSYETYKSQSDIIAHALAVYFEISEAAVGPSASTRHGEQDDVDYSDRDVYGRPAGS